MLAQHYASSSSFNAMPSTGVGIGGKPIKHYGQTVLSLLVPYGQYQWWGSEVFYS